MEKLYTISTAARRLCISERFLRRLLAQGQLKAIRLGRAIRLQESELRRLSQQGVQSGKTRHGESVGTPAEAPFRNVVRPHHPPFPKRRAIGREEGFLICLMLTIPEVGSEMAEGWSIFGSVGGWNLVLEGRSLIVSPVVSVTATPQVDVSVFVHGGDTQPPFTSIPVTDLITPEFATQLSGQGLEVPEEALRELSTILISSHTAAPTEWSVEVSEKVQQARDTLLV